MIVWIVLQQIDAFTSHKIIGVFANEQDAHDMYSASHTINYPCVINKQVVIL